jgi:hypothetical protein
MASHTTLSIGDYEIYHQQADRISPITFHLNDHDQCLFIIPSPTMCQQAKGMPKFNGEPKLDIS